MAHRLGRGIHSLLPSATPTTRTAVAGRKPTSRTTPSSRQRTHPNAVAASATSRLATTVPPPNALLAQVRPTATAST